MLGGMGSTAAPDISKGGTIDGDITITGDLKVEGGGSFTYDEIIEGDLNITSDSSSDSKPLFILTNTNTSSGYGGEVSFYKNASAGSDGAQ